MAVQLLIYLLLITSSQAWVSWQPQRHAVPPSTTQLHFFRRGDRASDDTTDEKPQESTNNNDDKENKGLFGNLPFFARKPEPPVEQEQAAPIETTAEPKVATTTSTATVVTPPPPPPKPLTPQEQAARYKAEAEKVRLEAERMDAELTLRKIERLEKELALARHKNDSQDRVEELQRQMQALQAKMRGEAPAPPAPAPSVPKPKPVEPEKDSTMAFEVSAKYSLPYDQESLDETLQDFDELPNYLKRAMAGMVELDYDSVEDIDRTELRKRLGQIIRFDYSFSSLPKPDFTQDQTDQRKEELRQRSWSFPAGEQAMELVKKVADGDEDKMARMALEYEYYVENGKKAELMLEDILQEEEWLQPVVAAFNKSAIDASIETLYPPCTRKTDQQPTLAQVKQLASEILPNVGFKPTQQPEAVAGGYVIRGTTRTGIEGNTLIDAIDKQLGKSSLKEKLTVLYTNDFTIFSDPDAFETYDPDTVPPILYVMGPDIVREPRRVALSIASALGLATTWYLSIYPFLLNPAIGKRVEEQLALADANMAPDLSFLTELSFPLFTTFVAIQLMHEVGHQVAAKANQVKLTVPTFVPSLITGITSTVTSFKQPPKNKDAMFDISVAGPLVGILASLVAIAIGSQMTLTSDPSLLPALPLEILRQSTLGGSIIDSVLGSGALSVPEGALGTAAVAGITIPLHPVAVAGYISLVVNSLSLLPIGTTDGGRIAVSLFGRGAKLLVGQLTLLALFTVGVLGSDLFLFYFAFCVAVQSGNEIPARNEVDKVGFSRVLVALAAYILGLLALIPFQ